MVLERDEFRFRDGSHALVFPLLETLTRWQVQHLVFGACVSRQITHRMEKCTIVTDVAIFT